MPLKELKDFGRLSLSVNETGELKFKVPVQELEKWDSDAHKLKLYKGKYTIQVGESSVDKALSYDFVIK